MSAHSTRVAPWFWAEGIGGIASEARSTLVPGRTTTGFATLDGWATLDGGIVALGWAAREAVRRVAQPDLAAGHSGQGRLKRPARGLRFRLRGCGSRASWCHGCSLKALQFGAWGLIHRRVPAVESDSLIGAVPAYWLAYICHGWRVQKKQEREAQEEEEARIAEMSKSTFPGRPATWPIRPLAPLGCRSFSTHCWTPSITNDLPYASAVRTVELLHSKRLENARKGSKNLERITQIGFELGWRPCLRNGLVQILVLIWEAEQVLSIYATTETQFDAGTAVRLTR